MDTRQQNLRRKSMGRRGLLAVSGMAAAVALAGCSDSMPTGTTTESSLPAGSPSSTNEQLGKLVAGNTAFALNLFEVLGENADNLFVSPYSISLALAMTYAGADGDTETAMRETLGFSLGEETHPAFDELQAQLETRETTDSGPDSDDETVDAFELSVGNALWGDTEYPFAEAYLDLVDEQYDGGFNEAAFADDPDTERERINDWVAEQTADRIEELIPEGELSPQMVLVLTNAIYFMASWEQEFDPEETTEATFNALDGTESTVPMMEQSLRTDYAALPRAQAIELLYVGGEVSMVLIVPDEGEFETTVEELSAETLYGIFESLGDANGNLRLPKFEYEFDAELSDALDALGMGPAFGSGADFSKMVDNGRGPGIDQVFHEAFISVDEQGTEAAAATAVLMEVSAPSESFDLTVDRPFIFCIRDRPTDAVLFLGQVTDAGAAQ